MTDNECTQRETATVVHMATALQGGAGVAAERLHASLLRLGCRSSLLYSKGDASSRFAYPAFVAQRFLPRTWADLYAGFDRRRALPGHLFTGPTWYRKTNLADIPIQADIVNLHWISRWIDVPSLFASVGNRIPIVWSLHDLNPITGGCHHTGDCSKYSRSCRQCPQLLRPSSHDQSYRNFQIKARWYQKANLHFVGNSNWTTQKIQCSALANYAKGIHTVPLGLDLDAFRPIEKKRAKSVLGMEPDSIAIGFASANNLDTNKGGADLAQALERLAVRRNLTLLTFGKGLITVGDRVVTRSFGEVSSPALQALIYSACDVFVVPSKIESFGLTALESSACGTPVVGYKTGAIPEIVLSGQTGLLDSRVGNAQAIAEMLQWMIEHATERVAMALRAREHVCLHYSGKLMAERYLRIYTALLPSKI